MFHIYVSKTIMKPPIKVFILGSCVSRDPFTIASPGDFKIVAYHARTSLASLAAPSFVDEKIVNNITSQFQRRMVQADMEKTVLKNIKNKDYDILLLDLIDERFDLSMYGASIHTISNEYKTALYYPNKYKIIGKYSDEKLEYWKKGFDILFASLCKKKATKSLVVNKAYWAKKYNSPPPVVESLLRTINEANDFLDLMYDYIAQRYPEVRFVKYNENELTADVDHKWGRAAFHYVREFWEKQLECLKQYSKI